MSEDSYYHLTDHRHGQRGHINSRVVGFGAVLVFLAALLAIGVGVDEAVKPSGCQPIMHQGKKVCETYESNQQVVFVPWGIWINGGSYRGTSYSSDGDGSTYSREYGYAGDSDPGENENSSYGDYNSDGDNSDSGSSGDSGFSGGGGGDGGD